MKTTWYCRTPRLLTTSALLLLFVLPAQAAAPEWLRAAARANVPSYPPETDAVILYDEQVLTVGDNGEMKATYRRAYKILRPEGRDHGVVTVSFDSETRLTSMKGWGLPAGGKEYEVKEKDAIESGLSDNLYQDSRRKILRIPAADPGNVVGYEYEQKLRPYVLDDWWPFQGLDPVLHSRYVLQLPPGWEYEVKWINHPEVQPSISGNSYVWEVRGVPGIETEPSMPSLSQIAGWMAIRFFPRAGASARAEVHKSWKELAGWYNRLNSDRRIASPEIKAKVAELTAGISDPVEKLRALARFVQREVRYVSIQIGIGGHQPNPAPSIFSNKYGDCKDKATLLSTMLREAGIDSHYLYVNFSRGVVRPEFPTRRFNHVILAIKLPDGVQQSFGPEVTHPEVGRLLLFDPTDSITPVGSLSGTLQATHGLLVTPAGGALVDLPLLPAMRNALQRVARLSLSATGTLSGEVKETYSGLYATDRRADYLRTAEPQRPKMVERFLGRFLSGVTLKSVEVPPLDGYDDNFDVRYTFEAVNYAKSAGNLLLVRPRVLGAKGDDVLESKKPRKYAIEFEYPTLQTDVVEIQLPPGYVVDELPGPVSVDVGLAKYTSKTELKDNVLRYERKFEVSGVFVRQEMFDQMRQFYRQIALDERSSAVLRKSP